MSKSTLGWNATTQPVSTRSTSPVSQLFFIWHAPPVSLKHIAVAFQFLCRIKPSPPTAGAQPALKGDAQHYALTQLRLLRQQRAAESA